MTDNNEKVIPNVDSKRKEERNVPDLRFKEFANEYKKINFGNSFKLYRGSSPRPIVEYISSNPNDPLWIKIGDMPENSVFVNEIKEHITIDGAKKSRAVYKGDMILSNSMSYGKPYILNVDGYIHDGWFVIRDYQKNYDRDYLMQLLSSPSVQKRYSQIAAGGVVLNISSDLVNSVCVKIPNIEEQKKISKFLSTIDIKINTQKKIIEDYKLLKKAICDDYRKQNCTKCKIKELALIGRGRVINSTEISHQKNPKYPVYSSQTLNNGIMGYLDGYDFDGEYITWTTDGANAGTVFYHNEKFNCTNVCGTIKVTNKMINPFYLSLILQYECKKYVSLNLANPKLMNNTMASIEVKVPNLDYQKRIINSVKIIDEKILNEEKVLQLYQSQKDYLLNHMFI